MTYFGLYLLIGVCIVFCDTYDTYASDKEAMEKERAITVVLAQIIVILLWPLTLYSIISEKTGSKK